MKVIPIDEIKKLAQNGEDEKLEAKIQELSKPSKDEVKNYLDTDEGKQLVQPMMDQYFSKGLESWKQNNLDSIVEEEVKKRFPEESEEQKRLRQLEQKLEQEQKERQREAMKNKALNKATEKGLPVDIIDHFVGPDEDTTLANLDKFEETFTQALNSKIEEKFKQGGREDVKGGGEPPPSDYSKMSPEEYFAAREKEGIQR